MTSLRDLQQLAASVPALDAAAMDEATQRQDRLTKPPGSLGRLETIATAIAGMQGRSRPSVARRAVIVAAGDHGIADEGVSAYPRAVTAQMVANFLAGGAAINALARQAGARVVVADFGVEGNLEAAEGLVDVKVARGTRNFLREPAMTRAEAVEAMLAGARIVSGERERGLDIVGLGEMGIANTSAATALVASLTGTPVAVVTGRGTGLDDAALAHKIDVIERALDLHQPDPEDPLGTLAAVGGLEIAGLAGVVIGAASQRIPVVVDGFITAAAAMVAVRFCPAAAAFLLPSHCSVEPGHTPALAALGLEPLFDLRMRLGEGTGAALAMQVIAGAVAALNEMATFGEAGVSDRTEA